MISVNLPTADATPPTSLPGDLLSVAVESSLEPESDGSPSESAPVSLTDVLQVNQPPSPDRENLKMILVGSRDTINQTIRQLHKLGFAEAGAWSPLLPTATRGQFMTILNRYFLKEQPPSSLGA